MKVGANIYYNSGNVGIGTATVNNILQVGSGSRLRISNGVTDYTQIGTQEIDGTANTRIALFGNTYSGASGDIRYIATSTGSHNFYSAGEIERMRITSAGNVGIGTTNPTAKLHIINSSTAANPDVGTTGINVFNPTNSAGQNSVITNRIGGSSAGKVVYSFDVSGAYGYSIKMNGNSSALRFNNNWEGSGTDTMVLANDGNVGIGTTSPVYKCHIKCGYNNVATGLHLDADDDGGNPNKYALTIWPYVIVSGEVGWKFRTQSLYGGTYTPLTLNNYGNVVVQNNLNVGSLTNPSDSRIKKDIEDINDATALNKLLLIQPTTYNYIDEERNKGFGKVYGFIAQQIREVIPEAVPIIEYIIPNIYKSCLINNKRDVYHSIPLDTPIDTEVKIRGSEYKIKEIYEDYFVIDKDIEDVEAFVYGYEVKDFHTLDKTYIFTLNVCATQELHRRIEAQSVLLKSQDDRIKDLETKVAMLLNSNAT